MTTPNIKELATRLRDYVGTIFAPALMCQAADLLQSQAKRIAELESALQSANTTIEELERKYYLTLDQRDDAIYMLADWCIAVEQDASWDGWDECYKNAAYRPCSIRELIDAEIEVQKDQ